MKLLDSDPEEVEELFLDMATNSKALTDEVVNICWYMRGSVNWDQAWNLTNKQRERISKLIKKNIERTEKTGISLL